MRDLEYLKKESRETINNDLLNIYNILSNDKNKQDIDNLIKNHKRIIDNSYLYSKNRYKTIEYLFFFTKNYNRDKSEALSNFMCMLNNKNLLNKI